MKSLKDYSLNITETEYHKRPTWSHSKIAKYAREGFAAIQHLHEPSKPTESMEFGSMLDSILTKGMDTVKEYAISDVAIPPAEQSVFDRLLAVGHKAPFDQIPPQAVQAAIDACDSFCSKYKKPETRMAKLVETKEYYEIRRTGKKVISKKDWNDAYQMAMQFRHDPYLKELFGTKSTDKVEYLYQLKFEVDWELPNGKKVKVRIMPDLLRVDHENKTVQYIDLKTSSDPGWRFEENFLRFRYDLEATVYQDVLTKVMMSSEEYRDYTLLNTLFTDISRSDMIPVTYECPYQKKFSFESHGKEYTYKDWETLLMEIIDYEEKQAVVPDYITLEGPNNILDILARRA